MSSVNDRQEAQTVKKKKKKFEEQRTRRKAEPGLLGLALAMLSVVGSLRVNLKKSAQSK